MFKITECKYSETPICRIEMPGLIQYTLVYGGFDQEDVFYEVVHKIGNRVILVRDHVNELNQFLQAEENAFLFHLLDYADKQSVK